MKYALLFVAYSFLPLQGPTVSGHPLNKFLPSGPSLEYHLMSSKRECKKEQEFQNQVPHYVSQCIPVPSGNLCNNFWKHFGDEPKEGCLIEMNNFGGPTIGNFTLGSVY